MDKRLLQIGCLFGVVLLVMFLLIRGIITLVSAPDVHDTDNMRTLELIRDPYFEKGINLYSPDRFNVHIADILDFGREDVQPVWEIMQWWNSIGLEGEELKEFMPGVVGYENEGAKVMVGPKGHEYEGTTLRLNGGAQFNYEPTVRDSNFTWPHLTVGQRLTPGHPENHNLSLARLKKVILTREARLLDIVKHAPHLEGQTTHYVSFITIQNLNRQSPGFGDYYSFALPVYDMRSLFINAISFHDKGNDTKPGAGKFVYGPAQSELIGGSLHFGDWVRWEVDILPYILQGLKDAWAKGFLKDSQDLDDYYLGGYSMGWETPGLYDAEIQVRNLSILAVYEDD